MAVISIPDIVLEKQFWKISVQKKALRHRLDLKPTGISGLFFLGLQSPQSKEQIQCLCRY